MAEKAAIGTTTEGRDWSVSQASPAKECYPKRDHHTWGEFAGLAIEMGGYSDLSAVDPYTGRRFWLGNAFTCDAHAKALNEVVPGPQAASAIYRDKYQCEDCSDIPVFDAIRRLLDAMQAAGFPDGFRESPDDPGPQGAISAPDDLSA